METQKRKNEEKATNKKKISGNENDNAHILHTYIVVVKNYMKNKNSIRLLNFIKQKNL